MRLRQHMWRTSASCSRTHPPQSDSRWWARRGAARFLMKRLSFPSSLRLCVRAAHPWNRQRWPRRRRGGGAAELTDVYGLLKKLETTPTWLKEVSAEPGKMPEPLRMLGYVCEQTLVRIVHHVEEERTRDSAGLAAARAAVAGGGAAGSG